MPGITVDKLDLGLLAELQRDGRASNGAVGDKIGLSASQVSRRVQRLEQAHVISQYAALLDPDIVGLGVIAFTSVTLGRHGEAQGDTFERKIADLPEVLECMSVTGEADYVLRIVATDLASFSEFMMKRLLKIPGVVNVKSNVALKTIKRTHVLPLDHVTQPTRELRKLAFSG